MHRKQTPNKKVLFFPKKHIVCNVPLFYGCKQTEPSRTPSAQAQPWFWARARFEKKIKET